MPVDSTGPREPSTYVGPYLGGVFTTLTVSRVEDYGTRLDVAGGLQWDQRFGDGPFVRSGVFYAGRGARHTTATVAETFVARYIEFPLLVGFRFPDDMPTRVFVMVGAQVGFQIGCKVNEDVHCSDYFGYFEGPNTVDYAVLAGGGLLLPLGKANLTIELRAMQGLRGIRTYGGFKNRGATVGGAYMLPLH